jgi:hypothetical protein
LSRATSSILTHKVRVAKRLEQGQSGADHNIRLYQMLDLDVTPQEGMILHCAGQASGEAQSLQRFG